MVPNGKCLLWKEWICGWSWFFVCLSYFNSGIFLESSEERCVVIIFSKFWFPKQKVFRFEELKRLKEKGATMQTQRPLENVLARAILLRGHQHLQKEETSPGGGWQNYDWVGTTPEQKCWLACWETWGSISQGWHGWCLSNWKTRSRWGWWLKEHSLPCIRGCGHVWADGCYTHTS